MGATTANKRGTPTASSSSRRVTLADSVRSPDLGGKGVRVCVCVCVRECEYVSMSVCIRGTVRACFVRGGGDGNRSSTITALGQQIA